MKLQRGASQVLFGFLPAQTVDLDKHVWRVEEWVQSEPVEVDSVALRDELVRLIGPWEAQGNDGGVAAELRSGNELVVRRVSPTQGVRVSRFPNVWYCRQCERIVNGTPSVCKCAGRAWAQLHFVGYHECGRMTEPYMPRCPTHGEVAIRRPRSASAADIRFVCPICNVELRRGFGRPKCECQKGNVTFTVHRAATVYTAHTVVLVNPKSETAARLMSHAGGSARALEWVLDGMEGATFSGVPQSVEEIRSTLAHSGLDETTIEAMIAAMPLAAGSVAKGKPSRPHAGLPGVPGAMRVHAERQATTIATGLYESREVKVPTESGLQKSLLDTARLTAIELCDAFPVLTGKFGYTRGGSNPSETTLRPYRIKTSRSARSITVYASPTVTEALFLRLDPLRVHAWLVSRGHTLVSAITPRDAREAILLAIDPLEVGAMTRPPQPSVHSDVLTLVHSYAHRTIRKIACLAGIEVNSLSELLVPLHLGVFIYAAARGGFVLGGLRALFEADMGLALRDIVEGESRCPLDPGCSDAGAACVACLHLGEPSCRHFNQFLDRRVLFGPTGLLTLGS